PEARGESSSRFSSLFAQDHFAKPLHASRVGQGFPDYALSAVHQSGGSFEQAPGRGLLPRLSRGTLQLSIRCSSVHFRPSLSLPVSFGAAALAASAAGLASLAGARDAEPTSSSKSEIASNSWCRNAMATSPRFDSRDSGFSKRERAIATRNPMPDDPI